MQTIEEFEDSEWAGFADVIFDLHGVVLIVPELKVIFTDLPEHIRDIAHCHGVGDTVFRDEAWAWLEDQLNG